MTIYRTILVERIGAVARITLNRPDKLNSFTREMLAEIEGALGEIAADPSLRALMLTGAGRAFGAGQDLREPGALDGPGQVKDLLDRSYTPVLRALAAVELPTLAAVNGMAAGAACGLALACDLVVAVRSASFLMAFSRIGLVPDSGTTHWLPRRIGMARALGMTLLAEPITAEQAAQWGLIWECVPDETFGARIEELAARLAAGPTRAFALAKRALQASAAHTLEQQLALEAELQALAAGTADFREGVAAFLGKRTATFAGH